MRREALPTLVVALAALLAFAAAAGTVGDPATTGAADARGVERDAQPRTEFPRVGGGGGGVGGVRGLLAGVVPRLPDWALSVGAAAAALLLVVLWRTAGGDAAEAAPRERAETTDAVEGVPGGVRTVPDWAERPADNGVFGAWRRLAEHVRPGRPDGRTPADYADAAREAGVAPDAVDELTALFRRVRYGPAEPTPERERRARAALARAGLDDEERGEDGDGGLETTADGDAETRANDGGDGQEAAGGEDGGDAP